MTKILSIHSISPTLHKLHEQKKSLVVAGGCFDLLHIGHITFLEEAKKQGDVLIVLLESDKSIKKRKGVDRPIHTQQQRAEMISTMKPVDVVILLSDTMTNADYDNLVEEIHPAVIATTEHDENISHKQRQARLTGAQVVSVNKHIPSVSTTKLLETLAKEL